MWKKMCEQLKQWEVERMFENILKIIFDYNLIRPNVTRKVQITGAGARWRTKLKLFLFEEIQHRASAAPVSSTNTSLMCLINQCGWIIILQRMVAGVCSTAITISWVHEINLLDNNIGNNLNLESQVTSDERKQPLQIISHLEYWILKIEIKHLQKIFWVLHTATVLLTLLIQPLGSSLFSISYEIQSVHIILVFEISNGKWWPDKSSRKTSCSFCGFYICVPQFVTFLRPLNLWQLAHHDACVA